MEQFYMRSQPPSAYVLTNPTPERRENCAVVMLEFNELSPTLITRFMDAGELPNFKRLYDGSSIFTTDAEEASPNLEPWIQWITVHSGLSYDQHGIFHLGDGHKLDSPQVWDLLSRAGRTVFVCGSMNSRYDLPINGAVLPDPWASGTPPYPAGTFRNYFTFVQRNVQEYTNDRIPLSSGDYLRFLRFMLGHGLSVNTGIWIIRQLIAERMNPNSRWKRATILDKLQWDVFKNWHASHRPDFATFFINSTAHFQHMYWRNMNPDVFTVKPDPTEQSEYRGAILFGYKEMDRLIGEALALTDDGRTILILCSALSQQPCLVYEDIGGKTYYRPRVFERVLEFAGVEGPYRIEPVMSEQFQIRFEKEASAKAAAEALRAVCLPEGPAMEAHCHGTDVYAGCNVYRQLPKDAPLMGPDGILMPFFRLFYQVEGLKSGMHHPDGILWIHDPYTSADHSARRISLRDVAPTLLSYFDLPATVEMTGRAISTTPGSGVPKADKLRCR
ncbi:alkaline phosphatase family protein [Aminobacter anthyllidis]|uniref:Alkaline phosphatase family protein n=1 Tax=Aminobacter anthyllidis TaxID=1035067 RepID=A0A9X1D8W9_9HYPH|nr:alkaline phosphatase family protein [Aminobacter anthyllidis]MBT1159333.1 alkaline phosphatase family protein [Aminobacter anthyllidis]